MASGWPALAGHARRRRDASYGNGTRRAMEIQATAESRQRGNDVTEAEIRPAPSFPYRIAAEFPDLAPARRHGAGEQRIRAQPGTSMRVGAR